MKKYYAKINYKANVQILGADSPDDVIDYITVQEGTGAFVVDYLIEDYNLTQRADSPDFVKVDARIKVIVETDKDIEEVIENTLTFETDGDFIVHDYEVYGWSVEDVK